MKITHCKYVVIMSYTVEKLEDDWSEFVSTDESIQFSSEKSTKNLRTKSQLIFAKKTDEKQIHSDYSHSFNIIVTQDLKEFGRKSVFLLFKSNKIYKTRNSAFIRIRHTLTPLLSSGQVILSEPLLREIMLPEPLDPGLIGSRLVDLLEQDPDGNPEWHIVIQVLMQNKILSNSTSKLVKSSSGDKVISLREYYEKMNTRLMKLHMIQVGTLGAHLVPLLAVPTVGINAASINDDEDSSCKKIFRLSLRGTLKKRNHTQYGGKKTWLMDAVEKQYLRSCMFLVMSGVNPNDIQQSTGDTALHIAVRLGNPTLVKLLLAYQADPKSSNTLNQTPCDIAKSLNDGTKTRQEIDSILEEVDSSQVKAKSYYDSHPLIAPDTKLQEDSGIFLLALDGGGTRALFMSMLLIRIEERMKQLVPDCKPIQSYFDYIAGTSAGAILGAALVYRNEPVNNIPVMLFKSTNEVFMKPLAERSDNLKNYLYEGIGESVVMSDLEDNNIIITSAIATVSPNILHLMTNYGQPRDGQAGPDERKVWEALSASAAAPGYFPPFEGCFLDGGVMCNNPTITAMVEIFRHSEEKQEKQRIGLVLSLGTGVPKKKLVDNIEVFVPSYYSISSMVSSAFGLKNLFLSFMDQSMQSNGAVVDEARTWCKSIGASYFRMSPPLRKDMPLDTTDMHDLIDMFYYAHIYALEEHVMIDDVSKKLLTKKAQ